jgi:hypothetical protein
MADGRNVLARPYDAREPVVGVDELEGRRVDPPCQETVQPSARSQDGNGEFVPLCRTPSHEGRGGASTVPCALTMTAADVTTVAAARAQERNRATVGQAHSL